MNSNGGFSVVTGTVSGSTITFGSDFVIDTATSGSYSAVVFDSSNNKLVVAHADSGNTNYGTAYVLTLGSGINLTSENFIGFAEDTVATGQPVTVNTKGAIDENQTSLTPGQQYFVQTGGTIGTSADSPSVVAGTAVTATKLIVKG